MITDIIPWDEADDDFAILIQTMNYVTQNETQNETVDPEVKCFNPIKYRRSTFELRGGPFYKNFSL